MLCIKIIRRVEMGYEYSDAMIEVVFESLHIRS